MKRTWATALLVVGAGLSFAVGSQAKTSHHRLKCGPGYVRHSVRVPERKHGRIVRHYGRIVYTRVQRCVKVTKPKTPSPPFPPVVPPATSTAPPPPLPLPLMLPPPPPPPPPRPTSTTPANTAVPTISGTATDGGTLSASTGTWTNSPTSYAYQWQRCNAGGGACQTVTGATTSTYLVRNADVGLTLRVSVTAGNASGSASAISAVTGPIGLPTDPVVVAVGDIACPAGDTTHSCRQLATETLAKSQNPNDVLVLGDNQYDDGLLSEYTGSGAYNATWGLFNPIVHPDPGNHEYAASSSAAGYFQYFGSVARPPEGYYSFNLGTWHIVALNSNCSASGCSDMVGGTTSSAQTSWLQSDLAANRSSCVLAMWHHPLFSSGWTLGSPGVAPLWTALYNAHADIVLNGHDHLYERYAQQDPNGNAAANGIREFVVGTGGESLNALGSSGPGPTLQSYDTADFGVLVLTLHASSYSWRFVNTRGTTVDSGTTACRGPGTAPAAIAGPRDAGSARATHLGEPQLMFDARPLGTSLKTVTRQGLPVAIHCSRACDLTITAWLRHGRGLHRIASFYETESQIPDAYSRILLPLPARSLKGVAAATLVLRFAALDAAGHHRVVTRTVSLR